MQMTTISLSHLTFGYDGQGDLLFDDANFDLDTSWRLGLVGRNGRGKTTLLKLLQGQLPYQGRLTVPVPLNYFPQPIEDESQLTLYAMQAITEAEQWQLERELNLLAVDLDVLWRPYASLSGGEQTKVRLALLFTDTTHFALIDEPTNHLDAASRAKVAAYLKLKQGFIVISHDRHFLDAVCDHTLAIDKRKISLTQGNYSVYEAAKKQQDAAELAENAKLKKDIGRLRETAAKKGRWAATREKDKYGDPHKRGSGAIGDTGFIGARAARVMQKRKNLEQRMDKAIDEKSHLLQNIEEVAPLTIATQPDHHEVYLAVAELTLAYDGKPLFAPVSFELHRGERLAIIGPNGSGKSSLLAALLGQFDGEVQGTVVIKSSVTISQVRQLYPDNRGLLKDFAASRQLDLEAFLNNLRKLGLERNAFATPIEQLSMGQQKKVELAKSLATPANLLIWDEPVNYLDLLNQDQLTASILAYQPTMLFVEHDQDFIAKTATRVVTLNSDNR